MKRSPFIWGILFVILILGLMAGCNNRSAQTGTPTDSETIPNKPFQFTSEDLEDYVIIYGENDPHYAQLANHLADRILEKYDIFLTTACDTDAPPADYEIVLGDTNRSEHQGRIMEYSVTVEDGRLQINAGGGFSAEQAVNYLCENIFTGQAFALDNGYYYETSFLTKYQEISDGTTARIMSANLLADAFADSSYKSAHYRAEIFAGMLLCYTPDVLGLQETDESWNAVLDDYLAKIQALYGISYTRHLATYENKINYTSLLYRSDKYQVDDSGVTVFNWWNNEAFHHNYHMRNISWVKLSALDNADEAFLVANTHWSYRTEHSDGKTFLAGSDTPIAENELRTQCKNETNAFVTSLKQTYPEIPIFLTGDFNTSLPFFTESGWTPTEFRMISEEAKSSGKAISLVPTSGHFDHLFGTGNYAIALYGFFKDANQHALLTDHPFVYVDVSF